MAKGSLRNIEVKGLKETLKALNKLPKEVQAAIRVSSQAIAEEEVGRLQQAGLASGDPQSRLVARAIKSRRDRVPKILAGGPTKLAPSRKIYRSKTNLMKSGRGKLVKPEAGDVFFGAEFGGGRTKTTKQFRPHKGRTGYWFYPQFRKDTPAMVAQWEQSLDDVTNRLWGVNQG